VTASHHRRQISWLTRQLTYVCVLLFAIAGIAETAHFHSDLGKSSSEQHCSLCIAAHSVARPAQATIPVAALSLCVGVLVVGTTLVPDSRSALSLYIRPPPAA